MSSACLKSTKAEHEFKAWLKKSQSSCTAEILEALIEAEIDENPYFAEGLFWAARPQQWWADEMGVVTKTIQRLTKKPPFKWVCKDISGIKLVLLRVGQVTTPEDSARVMVKYWRKAMDRKETPKQFGQLTGLGKHWGPKAPDIFATIIKDWPGFASLIHFTIDLMNDKAENDNADHPKLGQWKLQFPSIGAILKFQELGPEFHEMKTQEAAYLKFIKSNKKIWST